MVVDTGSERAAKARAMVFELLASNMRPAGDGPDNRSVFWRWASSMGISGPKKTMGSDRYGSKFAGAGHVEAGVDISNPAIAVNLDACIACGACVRACREVQEIGRASCRDSVGQYVEFLVVAESLKKTNKNVIIMK